MAIVVNCQGQMETFPQRVEIIKSYGTNNLVAVEDLSLYLPF